MSRISSGFFKNKQGNWEHFCDIWEAEANDTPAAITPTCEIFSGESFRDDWTTKEIERHQESQCDDGAIERYRKSAHFQEILRRIAAAKVESRYSYRRKKRTTHMSAVTPDYSRYIRTKTTENTHAYHPKHQH